MAFAAGKVKKTNVFLSEIREGLREELPFSDSDYMGFGLAWQEQGWSVMLWMFIFRLNGSVMAG
jgi:hypothetical protein